MEIEEMECGYCFAFAPVDPIEPQFQQAYQEAQKRWLELWAPAPGDWPQ